jgi:ubiquinone biosynthesis protein
VRREARLATSLSALVRVLGALKGAFAKAGQFASLRHDVLPPGGHEALAALQDQVAPIPFARVRPVVEAELGAPLETLFRSFEPEPLGAASIAQVHSAVLHDGTPVAVKIQYPWIAASLPADLAVLRWAAVLWARASGRKIPDLQRILQEFSNGLATELDFEQEAQVAAEIASNLEADPQIVVPRVYPSHSTGRVLTMSVFDTVRLVDARERLGVEPGVVLQILARAYAKQVFVDGLFHADPHPGNLFVINEPDARVHPRVLFVDFGLSKRLDPTLRRELRKGIHALLQRDLEAFVDRMDSLGMIAPGARPSVTRAVAGMFERIREAGGDVLSVAGSQVLGLKDEAKELLQKTPGLQLPNDLLLYAKTLTYLFALGENLDPDVDLIKLSLPYLLRFLAEKD